MKKGEASLDKSHVDEVERNISPPMGLAITIPVDGLPGGGSVYVYVCSSPFGPPSSVEVVRALAKRLELRPQ